MRRILLILWLAVWGIACASTPEPREFCMRVNASPNLNIFEGQAHVVALYVYPLQSSLGFQQLSVGELLTGTSPSGAAGRHLQVTVAPGQELDFKESFPPSTREVGIVADYYRAPGDPEGQRKGVVKARCGWCSKAEITLAPKDLLLKQ